MKRRIVLMSAVAIFAALFSATTASAYEAEVTILPTDSSAYSEPFGLNVNAEYWGRNEGSSTRKLYVILEYSIPGEGWVWGDVTLLDIGTQFSYWKEEESPSQASWRVQLNPYGLGTKGCCGTGYAEPD